MNNTRPDLWLLAGEASGDRYGGRLARALRSAAPQVGLRGVGGREMALEGVELLAPLADRAVVGVSEAVLSVPFFWRILRRLGEELRVRRPHAVILIDFPEFNLQFAKTAHRLGVPVIYYVPPQLWAWRRGRIRMMARVVSHVFTVFPFEGSLYEGARISVESLGHPLRDFLPDLSRDEARDRLGVSGNAVLLGLLPGSRRGELRQHLPLLLMALRRIGQEHLVQFMLALAPTISRQEIQSGLASASVPIRVVEGQTYEVMAASDLLLVASGTATLEAAWFGTPMVIFYRVSRTTTLLARMLLTVRHVGLPNLLAGREIVPELLDKAATGERLGQVAMDLIHDPGALEAQRKQLGKLRPLIGEPGVAERAARRILELVDDRP